MPFIEVTAAPKKVRLNYGRVYRIAVPASQSAVNVHHYNKFSESFEPVNGSPIQPGEDLDVINTSDDEEMEFSSAGAVSLISYNPYQRT